MCMFLINCEIFYLIIILIFLKFMHNSLSALIMNSRYLMISILNLHLLIFNCSLTSFNCWKILQMCFWYFFRLSNKNIRMSFKYVDANSFRKSCSVQLIYFWNVLEAFVSSKKWQVIQKICIMFEKLLIICLFQWFIFCEKHV